MYYMKKLLGLLLAMTLAWPVSAAVLDNVQLIGEIETIASNVHHDVAGGYYNKGDVNTRVLAGLSAQLVEDVTANVLFQYVNNWDGNVEGDNISRYERNVYVSNANVVLSNLFDCFEATIGRQFYGDEDSAVMYFGPNHYNAENFGRAPSLDAAKLTYADDVKALTIIAGKLNMRYVDDEWTALGYNYNGNFYGADFRMNLTDTLKLQVYGYDFRLDIDDMENTGFYGGKLAFNPEAGLFSVEYARNFDGHRLIKEGADTGYMVKADAKVNVEQFAVRGAFLYQHENFGAFGNYTPGLIIGHKLGGDMGDYSFDEGVRMFNLGVDFNPFEKWTFALDGYAFQDRFGHHAATWEGDLTAKYTHNEYVQLFAGLGYAKYGNDEEGTIGGATYKDAFHKDNFKWQLGMLINF
jgi:hypothetical protein